MRDEETTRRYDAIKFYVNRKNNFIVNTIRTVFFRS